MSEDEFTKLFQYVEKRFDSVEKRLEQTATKHQVDDLTNKVDGLAGLIKDYHQELRMLSRQVDRLKEAVMQIAQQTGVKLKVEL